MVNEKDKNLKLPNFLIVGAAKSGTSSLYNYLKDHPQVFMPHKTKEPLYFVKNAMHNINKNDPYTNYENDYSKKYRDRDYFFINSFQKYQLLFKDVETEKAIGEASSVYLYYYTEAIRNIKSTLGDVKIIIILRNPIERILSQYKNLIKWNQYFNMEPYALDQALKKENERIEENYTFHYHYVAQSIYYNQVKAYLDAFTNVRIYLTSDLKNNTLSTIQNIYEFLNIDSNYIPSNLDKIFYKTYIPKYQILKQLMLVLGKAKIIKSCFPKNIRRNIKSSIIKINNKDIKLSQRTKDELQHRLKEDIYKLEKLINRDLSLWLK